MSATAHLRLAWQAQRAGRLRLRDVMLTLAAAESGPGDLWAERCRAKLTREREGHFLGKFPSLADALANEEVRNAVGRLRDKYPPARVEWQLLAGDASRGHYTGRETVDAVMIQELLGPPAEAEVRRDAAEAPRGPTSRAKAAAPARSGGFPGGHSVVDVSPLWIAPEVDSDGEVATADKDETLSGFYLSVLFSIALLIAASKRKPEPAAVRRAG